MTRPGRGSVHHLKLFATDQMTGLLAAETSFSALDPGGASHYRSVPNDCEVFDGRTPAPARSHRELDAALGIPFEQRGRILDEQVAVLRAAWRPGPARAGLHHHLLQAVHVHR